MDSDLLKTNMICTMVVVLKFWWSLTMQGGARFELGTSDNLYGAGGRPAEDSSFKKAPQLNDEELAVAKLKVNRYDRVVGNDLENLWPGLIVAWASVICIGADDDWKKWVQMGATVLFTLSRILHTVSYVNKWQPARTIFWTLALIAILANGVVGIIATF